jgi:hypothetical protein
MSTKLLASMRAAPTPCTLVQALSTTVALDQDVPPPRFVKYTMVLPSPMTTSARALPPTLPTATEAVADSPVVTCQ